MKFAANEVMPIKFVQSLLYPLYTKPQILMAYYTRMSKSNDSSQNSNNHAKSDRPRATHFGFQEVPWHEKQGKVGEVFRSVAGQYDVMNDLMSFGLHRLWKRHAIGLCRLKPGDQVLDLAGGTGDLALKMHLLVGQSGHVILSDINEAMLAKGRERIENQGVLDIEYVQANAECLPFVDDRFDCVTIGFGLRNVTDKSKALASMYRCLKPGGRLLVLEFSQVAMPGLKQAYDFYSFNILPKIGKVVAKDEDSYRYLAESIRKHPDQETLRSMMEDVGFQDCEYFNLSGGIVALHRGNKY